MWRVIKIAPLFIFCCLIIFFVTAAIYHYVMLKIKRAKIKQVGTAVEVDG